MPSESPAASAKDLVETLLDVASQFILPDWRALVDLFPVLLGLLFVAWFALTIRKFATLGPTRRAPARIQPVTPPAVHMPGGSLSPILAALGAMGLFLGLVFGGLALWIGATLMVVTLLFWLREGMRDYDHNEPPTLLPVVVHEGPPPGVHMPGPSIRPFLGALGTAALFAGLVMGGWVLILAIVFLVWTLLGWLVDFTAEYRKVVEADTTGHLENIPPRRLPMRTLQVFAVLFALVGLWQLGIFPPAGPATADPGASGPPPSGPAGPTIPTVVARGVAFDTDTLEATAAQPFSILFRNEDPPGTPHDIDVRSGDGTTLQDQAVVDGGTEQTYEYTPLDAGEYVFICSFHPDLMTGTLTVQ